MNTIIDEALDMFGEDAQVRMVFEEFAELQNAICKFYRKRASREEVINERVDVQIVLKYIDRIFQITEEDIAEYERKKLTHIRNLIEQKRSTINGE